MYICMDEIVGTVLYSTPLKNVCTALAAASVMSAPPIVGIAVALGTLVLYIYT